MKKIFALILLTSLVSCGNGGGGGGSKSATSQQQQTEEGNYRAILRPLNNSLSGFLPTGFLDANVTGDKIQIKTLLDDDARVTHIQGIYEGTQCPNMSHDKNGDGMVDAIEMTDATGSVLVALDGDINSDAQGNGIYPMGGGFTYMKTASMKNLEDDLKARTGKSLGLDGRVVILHGVANTAKIPASAASLPGQTQAQSMPIVCGIIRKMK